MPKGAFFPSPCLTYFLLCQVKSVENKGNGKIIAHLLSGKKVIGDAMLYAMGRLGNTDSLNLQVGKSVL